MNICFKNIVNKSFSRMNGKRRSFIKHRELYYSFSNLGDKFDNHQYSTFPYPFSRLNITFRWSSDELSPSKAWRAMYTHEP